MNFVIRVKRRALGHDAHDAHLRCTLEKWAGRGERVFWRRPIAAATRDWMGAGWSGAGRRRRRRGRLGAARKPKAASNVCAPIEMRNENRPPGWLVIEREQWTAEWWDDDEQIGHVAVMVIALAASCAGSSQWGLVQKNWWHMTGALDQPTGILSPGTLFRCLPHLDAGCAFQLFPRTSTNSRITSLIYQLTSFPCSALVLPSPTTPHVVWFELWLAAWNLEFWHHVRTKIRKLQFSHILRLNLISFPSLLLWRGVLLNCMLMVLWDFQVKHASWDTEKPLLTGD